MGTAAARRLWWAQTGCADPPAWHLPFSEPVPPRGSSHRGLQALQQRVQLIWQHKFSRLQPSTSFGSNDSDHAGVPAGAGRCTAVSRLNVVACGQCGMSGPRLRPARCFRLLCHRRGRVTLQRTHRAQAVDHRNAVNTSIVVKGERWAFAACECGQQDRSDRPEAEVPSNAPLFIPCRQRPALRLHPMRPGMLPCRRPACACMHAVTPRHPSHVSAL